MRISDILRLSLINAFRGKVRTMLTVFASAISVAATILVLAIGVFAEDTVSEQLNALGISGVSIHPKKVASDAGFRLGDDDAVAVMKEIEGVDSALPVVIRYGSYSMKNWRGNAVIFGTGAGLDNSLDVELLYGRFYGESDIRSSANSVIIDADFAEMVYGRRNIVGKTLTITAGASREFTVIGVISPQSAGAAALFGDALPTFFYIPQSTLSEMCGAVGADQLLIGTNEPDAVRDAIALLERIHSSPNALKSEDISGFRSQIDEIIRDIGLFLTAVSGISVFIAGIGVMNTMLSTAVERRREVGIYMSLGARSRDILMGFIVEAGAISAIGAAIGAVVACSVLYLIGNIIGMELTLDASYIVIAVAAATVCGALFGVIPAVRASRTDPIDALRER